MGVALGVRDSKAGDMAELREDFKQITDTLAATRPTAVNLFWAIERMTRVFKEAAAAGTAKLMRGETVDVNVDADPNMPYFARDFASCSTNIRNSAS